MYGGEFMNELKREMYCYGQDKRIQILEAIIWAQVIMDMKIKAFTIQETEKTKAELSELMERSDYGKN